MNLQGIDRLVAEDLVAPGTPLAAAVAGMLNRLESAGSVATYTSDLAAYLTFAKTRAVDPLAPARDLVSAWVADARDRDYAPDTRRRMLSVVRRLYEEAIARESYAGANPTGGVARIRGNSRDEETALTPEEIGELLRHVALRMEDPDAGVALRARRDRVIVNLLLLCGLRSAELVGLRWDDRRTDGAYRVLLVRGKGGKHARTKLTPELDTLLEDWQGALHAAGIHPDPADPVFFGLTSLNGAWPPAVRRVGARIAPLTTRQMRRMIDEALAGIGRKGRRTSPHLLRRTSGTLVYERTHDIYLTQQHLRHASPQTTAKHYVRQADELADAGIDYLKLPKG